MAAKALRGHGGLDGTVMAYARPAAPDAACGDAPIGFTLFARLSLGD